MAFFLRKKTIIRISILVGILVLGAAAFVTYKLVDLNNNSKVQPVDKKPVASLTDAKLIKEKQVKVDNLIATGDEKSIKQAEVIVKDDVATAKASGSQTAVARTSVDWANVLIQTGRAQEALDTILLPLNKEYTTVDDYKYSIYGSISWAYRMLGDSAKSYEYLDRIPSKGWD
ncbi:MAG TPA: hypothetical protein PLZ58_01540 [Candidatus Saccharibacteria bacterium]|nr:hypothetical protein [Candidatus Saccharibacteria bacterium]HRQ06998.1 hypothetical protein [Candidatus Saccharibacteria bacterium]